MEQITAYKSLDGKAYTKKSDCLEADYEHRVKALIQMVHTRTDRRHPHESAVGGIVRVLCEDHDLMDELFTQSGRFTRLRQEIERERDHEYEASQREGFNDPLSPEERERRNTHHKLFNEHNVP